MPKATANGGVGLENPETSRNNAVPQRMQTVILLLIPRRCLRVTLPDQNQESNVLSWAASESHLDTQLTALHAVLGCNNSRAVPSESKYESWFSYWVLREPNVSTPLRTLWWYINTRTAHVIKNRMYDAVGTRETRRSSARNFSPVGWRDGRLMSVKMTDSCGHVRLSVL